MAQHKTLVGGLNSNVMVFMAVEMITLFLQHVAHFNEQTLHFLSVMPMKMNFNLPGYQDLVIRAYKMLKLFFAFGITMILV